MIDQPLCAVCGSPDWETIGRRVYSSKDQQTLADYVKARYRVLFELWCPGQSEVVVRFLLCRKCGFVEFAPRPTAEDVERKYEFLIKLGDVGYYPSAEDEAEMERATAQHAMLRRFLKSVPRRILDFGGGNGFLMTPFLKEGSSCSIVDLCPAPALPGIEQAGSRLEDMESGRVFDLVLCTHVLEHVENPRDVLNGLRRRLAPEGKLYVEVPMEIWKGPPKLVEPATHLNFFAEQSLAVLLRESGYAVESTWTWRGFGPLRHMAVVRAIATATADPTPIDYPGSVAATRRLLNPSLGMRFRRLLMHPDQLHRVAWNRLSGRQPSSEPSSR